MVYAVFTYDLHKYLHKLMHTIDAIVAIVLCTCNSITVVNSCTNM